MTHPKGWPNVEGKCCMCGTTREELEKPQEPEGQGRLHYKWSDGLRRDYSEPEQPKEPPLTPEEEEMAPGYEELARQRAKEDLDRRWAKAMGDDEEPCQDCLRGAHGPNAHREQPPPPPEGPEYTLCVCDHAEHDHAPDAGDCFACECVAYRTKPDFEIPPQPDRRPPVAIAYSVQGHLYEVAVSGDASVRAVDGALVIQHHLGPVAGICQVLPVINEEQT